MKSTLKDGYSLLHQGARVLAQIEHNGIRVDTAHLRSSITVITQRIAQLQRDMMDDPLFTLIRKKYGADASPTSRPQLAAILQKEGVIKLPKTEKGNARMDKGVLEKLIEYTDNSYCKKLLEMEKGRKILSTYLQGILREVTTKGFVHPSYNLHLVATYRSSCDNPNFQNQPVRDEAMAEIIRRSYLPRTSKYHLMEVDCSGAEVRIAACYHKDPNMIKYIEDESRDMHRDMAMQIFMLSQDKITKKIRHAAKNKYVFPVFYGSYYAMTTLALWDEALHLRLDDGILLADHLKSKGIKGRGDCIPGTDPKPGTFESHMKKVEEHFWKVRFSAYNEWKKRWVDAYNKTGQFRMKTGFIVNTPLSRNDIINYPIQGASFHCLLWSLIKIQKTLTERKYKTRIVGQIHDSIIFDVHPSEISDVLLLCQIVMTEDLPRAWKWICVPLKIEAELSPQGQPWFFKKEVRLKAPSNDFPQWEYVPKKK